MAPREDAGGKRSFVEQLHVEPAPHRKALLTGRQTANEAAASSDKVLLSARRVAQNGTGFEPNGWGRMRRAATQPTVLEPALDAAKTMAEFRLNLVCALWRARTAAIA